MVSALAGRVPKRFLKERKSSERKWHKSKGSIIVTSHQARKVSLLLFLLLLTFPAIAPGRNALLIYESPAINPFEPLMEAIGNIETMGNTMAFNKFENAVGIFQIRQVKVDEYNRQTGNKFLLTDMFDYENSRRVFLYFASMAGPYHFEKIAKAWNGSGPMTDFYWQRIRSNIEKSGKKGRI